MTIDEWMETEVGDLTKFAEKLQKDFPSTAVLLLPVGADNRVRFYAFDAACFFVPVPHDH